MQRHKEVCPRQQSELNTVQLHVLHIGTQPHINMRLLQQSDVRGFAFSHQRRAST